jgi:hypothetical protein
MPSPQHQFQAVMQVVFVIALAGLATMGASAPTTALLPEGVTYNPAASLSRERWQRRSSSKHVVENDMLLSRFSASDSNAPSNDELLRLLGVALPSEFEAAGFATPLSMRQTTGTTTTITGSKSAFVITYSASTPTKARVPFERAIRTWSEEFPCKLPIRVSFTWKGLGQSTLGATTCPFVISGSASGADKLDDDTMYTPVMAMALQGKDYTPANE